MKYLKKIQFEEIDRYTPGRPKMRAQIEFPKLPASVVEAAPIFLLIFVFLAIIYKAFELQVLFGKKNFELSLNNSIRNSVLRAERGVIYDRNGQVLARNKPAFSVYLNPFECGQDCEVVATEVAKLVPGIVLEDLLAKLSTSRGVIVLASGLSRDEIIKVETNLNKLKGVSTQVDPLREYLGGESFAHVLGFIGEGEKLEFEGKSGIEKRYNNVLKGESGSRIIEVNSQGTSYTQVSVKKPVPGRSVTLSIDKGLQEVAFEELKNAVETKKATGGAVVASDPSNGSVLALVSYPSFDPNDFSKGMSATKFSGLLLDNRKPFFNRPISAVYPPGSTYKATTALAALESQVIDSNSLVGCPSAINVGSFVFRDWYSGGRGQINVKQALQYSCDTFFYAVGGGYGEQRGVGIENLATLSKKLGFGKRSGIDLDGEEPGLFPDPAWKKAVKGETWYLGDTFISSIGQGNILATPLQVNNMMSFFASGGKIYKPRVVLGVEGEEKTKPALILDESGYAESIEVVREGLKMAVSTGGTAYPFFDFAEKHGGIEVAGKTGTAEFGNPVEVGGDRTHAWFTVFGPFENPNIVLTVMLEGGGSGSSDAAPVARKIMDKWFENHLKTNQ